MWDEVEVGWFKALDDWEAENICHLCGMPKSVCRSPETEGAVSVDMERCHVTAEVRRKQRAAHDAEMDLLDSLAFSARVVSPEAAGD